MQFTQGKIIKGVGGLYSVLTENGVYLCKSRGVFRHEKLTPMVGDNVEITAGSNAGGQSGAEWRIDGLLERKNSLVRPPIANIDLLVIVASVAPPSSPLFFIDKMTAVAVHKGIEPVICINKTDVAPGDEIFKLYKNAGFKAVRVSAETGDGMDSLVKHITGSVSAFTGSSGVGKSSLLNRFNERYKVKTGDISEKIGRGRHTTRHVELFALEGGGFVADTPGFSNIDIERFEVILKDDLQYAFPDFEGYVLKCKFKGCTHQTEQGCAVIAAVADGKITKSRHDSYTAMYEDAKNIKAWELVK